MNVGNVQPAVCFISGSFLKKIGKGVWEFSADEDSAYPSE